MKKKSIFSVSNLLLVFFVAVFLFAASRLVLIYLDYHQADSEYANLEQQYLQQDVPATDSTEETGEDSMELPFRVNFDALAAENPDTVGWVYVGACDISYPIVQGEDNEFYLHQTFEKQANNSGAIFLDYENKPDFTDFNTFVYGHNMKNGSMFGKFRRTGKSIFCAGAKARERFASRSFCPRVACGRSRVLSRSSRGRHGRPSRSAAASARTWP